MVHKPNIIYTALFVDDTAELFRLFPPVHKNKYGHHMTIAFRPKDLEGIKIGRQSELKIIGRVVDGGADALLVETNLSNNQFPHITLSTAEGVKPQYSNDMLATAEREHLIEYFNEPTMIAVTEGYFDGQNEVKA